MSDTWLLLGDFNQILSPIDKLSSYAKTVVRRNAFKDTTNQSGLIEVNSSGLWYTWTNNRLDYVVVSERHDRGLCND